jgi:hypothetical protein
VSNIGIAALVVIWGISEYSNAGGWPTHGVQRELRDRERVEHLDRVPAAGMECLLAINGWVTHLRQPISESEIKREIRRQAGPQQ